MRRSLLLAALLTVATATQPALAAKGGISLPLGAAFLGGSSNFTSASIRLPNDSTNTFAFHFTLPPDYKKGTPVYLRLYMQNSTACTAIMQKSAVRQSRPGSESLNTGGHVNFVNGAQVVFPSSGAVVRKSIKIVPPSVPALSNLKPGDAFFVELRRLGDDGADTCASFIFIEAATVTYRKQ